MIKKYVLNNEDAFEINIRKITPKPSSVIESLIESFGINSVINKVCEKNDNKDCGGIVCPTSEKMCKDFFQNQEYRDTRKSILISSQDWNQEKEETDFQIAEVI